MTELSIQISQIEEAVGNKEWRIQPDESESRRLRRSLIIVSDVKNGEIVTESNVKSLRPSIGIAPKFFSEVLGKSFNDDYAAGTALTFEKLI